MKEASDSALILNQRPNGSWRGRFLLKVQTQSLSKAEETEVWGSLVIVTRKHAHSGSGMLIRTQEWWNTNEKTSLPFCLSQAIWDPSISDGSTCKERRFSSLSSCSCVPVSSGNTSAQSPQSVLYWFSSLIQFSQADIHNLKRKTLRAGGGGK